MSMRHPTVLISGLLILSMGLSTPRAVAGGTCGAFCPADITFDQQVNVSDLVQLRWPSRLENPYRPVTGVFPSANDITETA